MAVFYTAKVSGKTAAAEQCAPRKGLKLYSLYWVKWARAGRRKGFLSGARAQIATTEQTELRQPQLKDDHLACSRYGVHIKTQLCSMGADSSSQSWAMQSPW